ncbi:type II secretion system protein GspM [Ferrimonas balearica]|uniref:type II secretion system protein GspM n=1 Tax=Ferrimonas balearica TaxID=44012 RepID=UPI001C98F61B|nr:type II secretion system protein GspM [Ferrimonas balearica]MBY5922511.1 type II secretion system protein M [Ferrimonas balearica]MBY5995495.1 type II secretion system protein M [Ferrimonas balearica]
MKALRHWSERFAALSRRERGLIALTAVVGLLLLVWALWLEPAINANGVKARQLESTLSQTRNMAQEAESLRQQLSANPNDKMEQELADLKRQLAQHQADLDEELVDLIPPEQMSAVLAQLLARAEGVTLIEMNIQPPVALVNEGGLYRHGVKLELEGSYFKLKAALERMEQLEQRFYWRFLDYQVTHYPKARLQLQLDTLGTEKEPIRVGIHPGTVAADLSR